MKAQKHHRSYRHVDNPIDNYLSLSTGVKIWRAVRPAVIFIVSLALVGGLVYVAADWVVEAFYLPMDPSDTSPVVVEIKTGSSSGAIANTLYDEGEDGEPGENQLIKNKAVFKMYVDFMGMGSKLRSGTYTFNRSMTIPELVDALAAGDGTVVQVVKFTLTEGMTIEAMAASLVEQGVLKSADRFLELCETPKGLTTHELMVIPEDRAERIYDLEGYLFPDTYEVYADSSEEAVLNKLITRFYGIMSESFILRAEELEMSIDEVITLASMIEKEAKQSDFAKVSAVFHNRLENGMKLQSDTTVQYLLGDNRLVLTGDELAMDSPYNTYVVEGLPEGPICNPGRAAIEAALYPDEDTLDGGYLYFCLKEPESGELAFAVTQEEHDENVARYYALWEAADAAREGEE